MATRLSSDTLGDLSSKVSVPAYRPGGLSAGIIHFGIGNFHRAHQAVYLDELFGSGRDHDWAILGAGVRSEDAAARTILERQDWLTTVVDQEAEGSSARITASMVGYHPIEDRAGLLDRLCDPAIRIVSLTITEGGYFLNSSSHEFDTGHPDIVADASSPGAPRTVFGLILAALRRRRDEGNRPFTVMSCDNIPGNGHVAQNAVAGLAELIEPGSGAWIREQVAFPNSMVDRITPATSDRERLALAAEFGIEDGWPVFCETFRQWVLEDRFPSGRPALETVGVTFVDDVAPYELMKIRILNGGHAAIAYPAALMDIHFVHEALQNDLIRRFLRKLETEEIVPTVPPIEGVDLGDYLDLVVRRFSNPKIGDTIARLCFGGSDRQPKFIVPTVSDRLAAGASVEGLALVSATWARYCYGQTDSEQPIAPNDPNWDRLQAHAKRARDNPSAWLEMRDIYGLVGSDPGFAAAFTRHYESLWAIGAEATLRAYLGG